MQVRDWSVRLGGPAVRARHLPLRGPLLGLVGWGPWSPERRRAHLTAVMRRRTAVSGWFGLKCHWHHFRGWFVEGGLDVESDLRVRQWVWIRRRDTVAQAVSWARALQTGQWASWQASHRRPVYRPRQIESLLWRIRSHEQCWERTFDRAGADPLCLDFEDVVEDATGAVASVLRVCERPVSAPIAPTDLRPQADAINREWIRRFRAEGT